MVMNVGGATSSVEDTVAERVVDGEVGLMVVVVWECNHHLADKPLHCLNSLV